MTYFRFQIEKTVSYMGGTKVERAIESINAKTKIDAIEKLCSYGYSVGPEVK